MESNAFLSLEALRSGHSDLLQSVPDSEDKITEAHVGRIREFLRRAAATGEVLDIAADRKQVQGLLDYWSATVYSQGHREPGGPADVERLPRDETVLAEFKTGTVDKVTEAADAWFRQLTEGDRDLARRILLRLVRLPSEGQKLQTIVATRSALQQLGSPTGVDAILDSLAGAGVIRVEKAAQTEDDQISLRFDALTRSWKEYAGWVDRRVRFRDATKFWNASGRDRTALIRDELLDEAMDFHDKNELEQKFVTASRERESSQNRVNLVAKWVLAAVAACALVFAEVAWAQWSRANQEAMDAETQKQLALQAAQKSRKHENEATSAEHALKAKFKLSYMVTVTRTLAEIATAVSDGERQIAVRRMEVLTDSLLEDPDFAPIFQEVAASLDRVKTGASSPDDHKNIAREALKIGRTLKAEAIHVQDPNLLAELTAQRIVSFQMARFCTQQIVKTFQTQSFVDADPYIKEFKLLYWGELGIVEQKAVQAAMILFGQKLREIDRKIESQLPDPKSLLDPALLERFQARPLREKFSILRSASLKVPNTSVVLTGLMSHRVPAQDSRELAEILNQNLIPALDGELKEPLAPNDESLEDY